MNLNFAVAVALDFTGDPFAAVDGSLNAPTGTPQFPNLFTSNTAPGSYATRPPWKVAGVDYHVGIDRSVYPTNAGLKDPATASLPSGVTRSGTTMTIGGNSVLLDGFDFSLGGGWQLQVNGNNCTVQNCNWVATQFMLGVNGSTTLIQNCEFNIDAHAGNKVDPGSGYNAANNSTTTYQYNYIYNGYGVMLNAGNPCTGQTWIYKWNVFANSGYGFAIDATHGDWYQSNTVASGQTAQETDFLFNTCIQQVDISIARCQGLSIFSAGANNSSVNIVRVENNTLVAHEPGVTDVPNSTGAYVNWAILVDWHWVTTNGSTIYNNYCDRQGMDDFLYGGPDLNGHGTPWGMPFVAGNIDMRTGAVIANWSDQYRPVAVAAAFSLNHVGLVNGQLVGTMTAYSGPIAWSITAGNGSGFYAIDNSGNITVTSAGVSGITAGTANLTCLPANSNATNGTATSAVATITVS